MKWLRSHSYSASQGSLRQRSLTCFVASALTPQLRLSGKWSRSNTWHGLSRLATRMRRLGSEVPERKERSSSRPENSERQPLVNSDRRTMAITANLEATRFQVRRYYLATTPLPLNCFSRICLVIQAEFGTTFLTGHMETNSRSRSTAERKRCLRSTARGKRKTYSQIFHHLRNS